jgi:WD40 repeat protein
VCVAVTPDGKRVLAGGWSNPLRIWDVETRKEQHCFNWIGPNDVFAIAVSPDGSTVAWGSGPYVRLADLKNPNPRNITFLKGHTWTLWSVAFSRDGKRLLTAGWGDRTMRLWEVASRKQLDVFPLAGAVMSAAFTPDEAHALVGLTANNDKEVPLQLWDLKARRDEHRLDNSRGHMTIVAALCPDGRRALSGSTDKVMRLWDVATGKELQRFTGHTNRVRNVAFLPDAGRVLSVSYDGTARIWDVESGRQLYNFTRHRGGIKGVVVAPDGRHVFTVDDHGVMIRWRLPDPAPKR